MNWEAIGALGEVFGAIAVVLSLVYLGAQVRHNTRALRGSASASAVAGFRDWNANLIGDPVMTRIFRKGVEDMNSLDEDERAQFLVIIFNFVKTYEDLHYQHAQGAMGLAVWTGWEKMGAVYLTSPGIRQFLAERRGFFNKDFQAWVDSLQPDPDTRRIDAIATDGVE